MKNGLEEIFTTHQEEVAYRTDRWYATFGEPQLSQSQD
jgi:hypothetical protein